MALSRRTRLVLISIAGAVAIAIGLSIHGSFQAWKRFIAEDQIADAGNQLKIALIEFQEDSGSLPTNLTQLVPRYLSRIPAAPAADAIDYRVLPDGTNWQISIHSHLAGRREIYLQRSSGDYTPEEQRLSGPSIHGWLVFREKRD